MKILTLTFLASLLFTLSAHAQTPAVPTCEEGKYVYPCVMSDTEAKDGVIQMMLENSKGSDLLKQTAKDGMEISMFTNNPYRVTLVQDDQNYKPGAMSTSVMKYEILLSDCLGTDQCEGSYLWTVTATTQSDGYSYTTAYQNTL